MPELIDVRPGVYFDSVALMRVSRTVGELAGVRAALVAMATPLNLELLAQLDFPATAASTADLVVAVRADDPATLDTALATLDEELAALRRPVARSLGAAGAPRSVRTATRIAGADLAFVAVPGEHAFTTAMEALDAGLHVMVFSDGVSVEQEIALKDAAAARGLLVMGPDCGTAIVSGAGLGFANVTTPGPVGLVAASGTGAQQLCALLDAAGVGVSHVLGVGGRDLSAAVGGRATRQALAALGEDPATEVVVLVSKPAAPEVAGGVHEQARALGKPVVTAVLGLGHEDLTAAAEKVLATLGREAPTWPSWPSWPSWRPGAPAPGDSPPSGALRGLYSGGTLCDEAMVIATERLGPIRSNIPLDPALALPDDLRAPGHVFLDFGDDRLTAGRPHPMVDGRLRLDRLAAEARDPAAGVLLLDVVLGHGAHPDPAAELAPAIADAIATAEAAGRTLAVVTALIGTAGDPQGLTRQAEALRAAGAAVFASNAQAARHAVALIAGQIDRTDRADRADRADGGTA